MQNITSSKKYFSLLSSLKEKVKSARIQASRSVNKHLILLYHQVGSEILRQQKHLGWGAKIIEKLSHDLSTEFPEMKGFSAANLHNMRRFAEIYSDEQFVQQVAGELPWYHHVVLMEKLQTQEDRLFYIHETIKNNWSRSVLVHQIEIQLHKRQGKSINNFKNKLPEIQSQLAEKILKDPYIFDFLSLGKDADEREIESGLTNHMQKFLLELGAGFAFVGRQYALEIGGEDFYIDLLFYHLHLRCYIVIELKADKFKPEYAGKMNFYLSAIDDLLKHQNDNPSIGLILCKTKNGVVAEYALRDINKAISLSGYNFTEKLPKNLQKSLPSVSELEREMKKLKKLN